MYVYYCLIVLTIIPVTALCLYMYMKNRKLADKKNMLSLIICTVLAVVCAILAPLLAEFMVKGLYFSVFVSVPLSFIVLTVLAAYLFSLIRKNMLKKIPVLNTAETETTQADAGKAETVKTEAVQTDAEKSITAEAGTVRTNAGELDNALAGAAQTGAEKSDIVWADAVKAEPEKEDTVKTGAVKTDVIKTDDVKTEVVKTDAEKTDTAVTGAEQNYNAAAETTSEAEVAAGIIDEAAAEAMKAPDIEAAARMEAAPAFDEEKTASEIKDQIAPEEGDSRAFQDNALSLSELVNAGIKYKSDHDFIRAISCYEAALSKKPDDALSALIVVDLCSLYKMTNQKELAYKTLNSAGENLLNLEIKEEILRNL